MVRKDVPPKVYEPEEPAYQDVHTLLLPLHPRQFTTNPECPQTANRRTGPNPSFRVKQYGKIRLKT